MENACELGHKDDAMAGVQDLTSSMMCLIIVLPRPFLRESLRTPMSWMYRFARSKPGGYAASLSAVCLHINCRRSRRSACEHMMRGCIEQTGLTSCLKAFCSSERASTSAWASVRVGTSVSSCPGLKDTEIASSSLSASADRMVWILPTARALRKSLS